MKNQQPPKPDNPNFVEPSFPPEFLDCFIATSFQALTDWMQRTGAPAEALTLLDCAHSLTSQARDLAAGDKIHRTNNQAIIDGVTDASRSIAALGGVFYAPDGTSVPRVEVVA